MCVKYSLEIHGKVASDWTIPVASISGSKTRSHCSCAGEPAVGRKCIPIASFNVVGAAAAYQKVVASVSLCHRIA